MAPNLEKKKAKALSTRNKDEEPAKKTKTTDPADAPPAPKKRKAAEDTSPVVVKKKKAEKKSKTADVDKPKPKPKPKPKAKRVEEPDVLELADDEKDAAVEDEVEDEIQALADGLDPDDEQPTKLRSKYKDGQPVGKIPKVSKALKQKKPDAESFGPTRVLYVGHLPHGFYEHQMREYFEQFGNITRLRLSRNKKTGASKHFAFVEFTDADVAEIVAKTMDNYLLFGHILKCKLVPPERIHEKMWEGANRRFKKVPRNRIAGARLAAPRTEQQWAGKIARQQKKRASRTEKLKSIGYEFEFPEMEKPVAPPAIQAIEPTADVVEPVA